MANFLYLTGVDFLGRPVVVFVGRHFQARNVDLNKVCFNICVNGFLSCTFPDRIWDWLKNNRRNNDTIAMSLKTIEATG